MSAPGNMPPRRTSSSGLKAVDFSLVQAARRVIESALSVVPGQRVLIIADTVRIDLGDALLDACGQRAAQGTLMVLDYLQPRPHRALHPELRDMLRTVDASVFIAGFEAGESGMRRELVGLVQAQRIRHAHMVGVSKLAMLAGMSVDPRRIANLAGLVRGRLRGDSRIHVRSAEGTQLEISCSPRHAWAEHSGLIRRGLWENLPTGEIITSPGDVNGSFVCTASMSEAFGSREGVLRWKPVTLRIEHGYVRSVHCPHGPLARDIQAWLRSGTMFNRVGMVSFGTNIGLSAPTGEIICDQNMPGVHLSLGTTCPDETHANWDADGQLVLAGHNQDVDLDGRALIRSGRYLNVM